MRDYFFPDMRLRNTVDKELLEFKDVEPDRLQRTIRQFKLINYLLSASSRLLREHFFSIMEQDPGRVYTLLDVGAGGCDIAIRAADEARQRGLKLNITALDNDTRILPLAYQAIRDYPEIQIIEGNALDLRRLSPFDFVFSNHLLHHLDWADIKIFLDSVIARTRLAFLMNDLKRSNWAYLGFTIFSRLLTPRSYHFHDGRLSIRRAFLPEELRDFMRSNYPNTPIRVIETYPARVVVLHVTPEALFPSKNQ
ncbi:MAG: methyltransferase domain-containing protein [Deltaproteobacteria bacterium]|nr:methyltransferase domain-containing protein [Deltaproteobacteria bacterium]TLN04963.1 MAG: methyltransferase domain-containing protein [bacterium]